MAMQQQQQQQQLRTAAGSSSSPCSALDSKPKIESIIPLFDLINGSDPIENIPAQLTAALPGYFVAAAEKVEHSDYECCECCGADVHGRLPLVLPEFFRSLRAELMQGITVLGLAAESHGRCQVAVVAVLTGITKADTMMT
jgi:hypothetical protein